jgi:hypothetical protein
MQKMLLFRYASEPVDKPLKFCRAGGAMGVMASALVLMPLDGGLFVTLDALLSAIPILASRAQDKHRLELSSSAPQRIKARRGGQCPVRTEGPT